MKTTTYFALILLHFAAGFALMLVRQGGVFKTFSLACREASPIDIKRLL